MNISVFPCISSYCVYVQNLIKSWVTKLYTILQQPSATSVFEKLKDKKMIHALYYCISVCLLAFTAFKLLLMGDCTSLIFTTSWLATLPTVFWIWNSLPNNTNAACFALHKVIFNINDQNVRFQLSVSALLDAQLTPNLLSLCSIEISKEHLFFPLFLLFLCSFFFMLHCFFFLFFSFWLQTFLVSFYLLYFLPIVFCQFTFFCQRGAFFIDHPPMFSVFFFFILTFSYFLFFQSSFFQSFLFFSICQSRLCKTYLFLFSFIYFLFHHDYFLCLPSLNFYFFSANISSVQFFFCPFHYSLGLASFVFIVLTTILPFFLSTYFLSFFHTIYFFLSF